MKHGGNIYSFAEHLGCLPEQVLDFSANLNPEQALDWRDLQTVQLRPYADPAYTALKQALKNRYPLPQNADIEVFNGASAAIFALLKFLRPKDLVLYTPLYSEYAQVAGQLACTVHSIDRFKALAADVPQGGTVVFVNPSTPDGACYDLQDLMARWQAANCTIIVDESFLDFCGAESVAQKISTYDKVYLIKSLSKFYGCAGIRIGFIAGIASSIQALKSLEPAWKLSSFDMAYMQQALGNTDFIAQTRTKNKVLLALLQSVLEKSGLFAEIYPSQANFILTRLAQGDGYALQKKLEPARILIRVCDTFEGLDEQHVRFAVKTEAEMMALAKALAHV